MTTTSEAAPATNKEQAKNSGDKKPPVTGGSGVDYKSMNRDKLMDAYSALVITAKELGVEFHSVKPDVSEQDLRNSCLALDARITLKKRAIEKHQAEQAKKTARAEKAARAEAKAKAKTEKATKSEAAPKGKPDTTEEQTDMAARKTAKTTGSKARGKVKGKTKATGKRAKFDASAKIHVTDKTNPRREGSSKYDEYALLLKYNGKTVGAFLEAGGKAKTISSMLRRKLGKVA